MSWASAVKRTTKQPAPAAPSFQRPAFDPAVVDSSRLVRLDFETYYDDDYTLSKLSTSEYIRDPRFEALMVGIRVGNAKTKVVPGPKIAAELRKIPWAFYDLLCHHTHFDGLILSHHYGIVPRKYYCSLSMARGLHSNDIGAGLDDVSKYYDGAGKLETGTEDFKSLSYKALFANKVKWGNAVRYCGQDVDEMDRIFWKMLPKMPASEIDLIHTIVRMFCDPVLKVDIPRVEKELAREIVEREERLLTVVDEKNYSEAEVKEILKTKAERALIGKERQMLFSKRVIGSGERFAALLRAEGVEPPVKISPAWVKKPVAERDDESKWTYAFAKDDLDFTSLPDRIEEFLTNLNLNKKKDILELALRQTRLQQLVDARLAVKSTTNITRAERFLKAGANGMPLPVGYAYYRAHTGRLGGSNKMNMQNLKRGGELRLSILAPKGHEIVVVDSGQIEARVNGWLWGQEDLLDAFRAADTWDKARGVARGGDRDAYCKMGDLIYGREITTDDKTERFVGKVCFAPDTLVLTNRGLKPIIEVRSNDLLWDGAEWVSHSGLVPQGEKVVIRAHGLAATADHEILTEHGWAAWSEVHTDPSLFQSALCLANSPSSAGSTTRLRKASCGGIAQFAGVAAAPNQWSTQPPCAMDVALGATLARSEQPVPSATGSTARRWSTKGTALVCSIGSLLQSVVARILGTPVINITVPAGYASLLSGSRTVQSSCGTFNVSPVGMIQNSTWIAATPTGITNQETSGSSPEARTRATGAKSEISKNASLTLSERTQTYDLANAGPRHRFAVWTKHGFVIAHNCVLGLGYQMGAPKLQITLAKGALGGPPVYFELDKCHQIVNAYRRKNHRIESGWQICKGIIEDMAAGVRGSHGPISWEKETLWLPNGMALKYPDLKKRQGDKGFDEWTYQGMLKNTPVRKKIYGGLLCENIVQALARIIVMAQLLEIDKKYRVVMTTHDENVALAKTKQAPAALKFMLAAMRKPLPWCADIPLNAEGGHALNYSK